MLLLGNIFSLIGSCFLVYSGYVRGIKKTIIIQTLQSIFFCLCNLVLNGISGVITNILTITKNILGYNEKYNNFCKVLFISLQIILCIIFNNLGFIGWLPAIAGCIHTLILDTKDERLLKLAILSISILWCIHDGTIGNIVGFIFNFATIISCFIYLRKLTMSATIKEAV